MLLVWTIICEKAQQFLNFLNNYSTCRQNLRIKKTMIYLTSRHLPAGWCRRGGWGPVDGDPSCSHRPQAPSVWPEEYGPCSHSSLPEYTAWCRSGNWERRQEHIYFSLTKVINLREKKQGMGRLGTTVTNGEISCNLTMWASILTERPCWNTVQIHV